MKLCRSLKSTDANRSRSTIAAGAVDEFSGKCCTCLQITQSAEQSQQACTLCFLFHRWEHCRRLAVSSVKQKGLKNPASKELFCSNFVYVTIRPQHRAVHAPKSGMWWIGRGWVGEWKGPARGLAAHTSWGDAQEFLSLWWKCVCVSMHMDTSRQPQVCNSGVTHLLLF